MPSLLLALLRQFWPYMLAALLLGGTYAGCKINAWRLHRTQVGQKVAEKTVEVDRADEKTTQELHRMGDDELADFIRRGGVCPKH